MQVAKSLKKSVSSPGIILSSALLRQRIYLLTKTVDEVNAIAGYASHIGVDVSGIETVPAEERGVILYLSRTEADEETLFRNRSWVTMRHGPFKGDVGLVQDVTDSDVLKVAVVPRFYNGSKRPQKEATRKLMTENTLRTLCGEDPTSGPDTGIFTFKGNTYLRNGLQIIETYGIHSVQACVPNANDAYYYTVLGYDTRYITNKAFLRIGDRTQVISGSLKGTRGVTVAISNETASIEVDDTETLVVQVHLGDIDRQFDCGTLVVVRIGEYVGQAGFVVSEVGDELCLLDARVREEVRNGI